MSTTLTPETLDSCNVQVTVLELRPSPFGSSKRHRHAAGIELIVGSFQVEGHAMLDEAHDGRLCLIEGSDPYGALPPAVMEVLEDLGSPHIAFRVREAIEAAVQQYDREMGALGDGPDSVWVVSGPPAIRPLAGTTAWDDKMRLQAGNLARIQLGIGK